MEEGQQPPELARRLLKWYSGRQIYEELSGDLEEYFYMRLENGSLRKAKLYFWRDVVFCCKPYAWSKDLQLFTNLNSSVQMFKNYVKTALRNMGKHKAFTAINMVGLATSMVVALVFIGITISLLQYDDFHEDTERLYRVITKRTTPTKERFYATTTYPLASAIKREFPIVEQSVGMVGVRKELVFDRKQKQGTGFFTDGSFFELFSFPLLQGNPATALSQPNSIVLTKKVAKHLFGDNDPLGKTVTLHTIGEYTVTGVTKTLPKNTHLEFDYLVSATTLPILEKEELLWKSYEDWSNVWSSYVYLKVMPKATHSQLQSALGKMSEKLKPGKEEQLAYQSQRFDSITPSTLPLDNQLNESSIDFVMIFGIFPAIVLLLAFFNYTNLTMARSISRFKEIGVRKVMGARKSQVFWQFITEAIVLSVSSFLVAFVLLVIAEPSINSFLEENNAAM